MKDSDEEIDTAEIEEEEWIETHRRMKWRLAIRIASLPDERWTKKAATWDPRSQHQVPNKQTSGETEKQMGR